MGHHGSKPHDPCVIDPESWECLNQRRAVFGTDQNGIPTGVPIGNDIPACIPTGLPTFEGHATNHTMSISEYNANNTFFHLSIFLAIILSLVLAMSFFMVMHVRRLHNFYRFDARAEYLQKPFKDDDNADDSAVGGGDIEKGMFTDTVSDTVSDTDKITPAPFVVPYMPRFMDPDLATYLNIRQNSAASDRQRVEEMHREKCNQRRLKKWAEWCKQRGVLQQNHARAQLAAQSLENGNLGKTEVKGSD